MDPISTTVAFLPIMKKVLELMGKDPAARQAACELQGQVFEMMHQHESDLARIAELESQLEFQGKMVFAHPFFWVDGDQTPYCQTCWEKSGRAVHLLGPQGRDQRKYHCTCCRTSIEVSETAVPMKTVRVIRLQRPKPDNS